MGATGTFILLLCQISASQHPHLPLSLTSSLRLRFIFVIIVCLSRVVTKSRVLFGIPALKSEGSRPSLPPLCIFLCCVSVCVCSYKHKELIVRPCVCVCVCACVCVIFYLFVSAFCTQLFHPGCPLIPLPVFHTICVSVSLLPSVCVNVYL